MAARPRPLTTTVRVPAIAVILGAMLAGGCTSPAPEGYERVRIDGRTFTLELAADDESRIRGLAGRDSIPGDGGMLFVFPDARVRQFVMRDCLVDIDIIFLDGSGRVVRTHRMAVEQPQGPDESRTAYEQRLTRYSSRFATQFAIELQGGMLDRITVREGEQIPLDLERLKSIAR